MGQKLALVNCASEASVVDRDVQIGRGARLVQADCVEWMGLEPSDSIDGVVTDPPYGLKEFLPQQVSKLRHGNRGGVWRIPPSFDGHRRSPLPRFTALSDRDRDDLTRFFERWARALMRVLKPGAHVFIASNSFVAPLTWSAVQKGGLEWRGEVIRLVRTLRGGDRPKNAESEFEDVCSMPRGCYEPWGIFRKPLPAGMRVQDALRAYGTGGLRRLPDGNPFLDVIPCGRTPQSERAISSHPSLKPQSFLRQLVRAVLPLGTGVVLDPFAGSGSTIAAAEALGVKSVGVELDGQYFDAAVESIPRLAAVRTASREASAGLF